jgi:hypothetical protein
VLMYKNGKMRPAENYSKGRRVKENDGGKG